MHDVGVIEGADHLADRVGLADVGEELVAEAGALARALDDARDVDERHRRRHQPGRLEQLAQHGQARVGNPDNADVRLNRGKRVVGREHVVARQRVEQGRLADVGQADDSDAERHEEPSTDVYGSARSARRSPKLSAPGCQHRTHERDCCFDHRPRRRDRRRPWAGWCRPAGPMPRSRPGGPRPPACTRCSKPSDAARPNASSSSPATTISCARRSARCRPRRSPATASSCWRWPSRSWPAPAPRADERPRPAPTRDRDDGRADARVAAASPRPAGLGRARAHQRRVGAARASRRHAAVVRAAAHRDGPAGHRAAGAAGARPLGRAAARTHRRGGRHGRARRLRDAGQRRRARWHRATRPDRAADRRQEHRGRFEGRLQRLPRGDGGDR